LIEFGHGGVGDRRTRAAGDEGSENDLKGMRKTEKEAGFPYSGRKGKSPHCPEPGTGIGKQGELFLDGFEDGGSGAI